MTAHFGATLTNLNLLMAENIQLETSQLRSMLQHAPALRFLSLRRVGIGSLDAIRDAYRAQECRLHSLSLWNSWVEPASLGRFAFELAVPEAAVNLHLREFRFNYDDLEDDEPRLLDEENVEAFTNMLAFNQSLTFFEIALDETLHDIFGDRLISLDGATKVPAVLPAVKLAFLGVVTDPDVGFEDALENIRRKRRRAVRFVLPARDRAAIVKRIWSFLSPVEIIQRRFLRRASKRTGVPRWRSIPHVGSVL